MVINRLTIPVTIDSTTVLNSTYTTKFHFEKYQGITLRYFKGFYIGCSSKKIIFLTFLDFLSSLPKYHLSLFIRVIVSGSLKTSYEFISSSLSSTLTMCRALYISLKMGNLLSHWMMLWCGQRWIHSHL